MPRERKERRSALRERLARHNAERDGGGSNSGSGGGGIPKSWIILSVVAFIILAGFLWWKSRVPKGPWDVNKATIQQLETLPGIGPETARDIISGRPYEKPEDLIRVKGIGEKTVEKIKGGLVFPAEN